MNRLFIVAQAELSGRLSRELESDGFSCYVAQPDEDVSHIGAEVVLVGPPTLLPKSFEKLGVKVVHDFDSVIGSVDVINMLRVQFVQNTGNIPACAVVITGILLLPFKIKIK